MSNRITAALKTASALEAQKQFPLPLLIDSSEAQTHVSDVAGLLRDAALFLETGQVNSSDLVDLMQLVGERIEELQDFIQCDFDSGIFEDHLDVKHSRVS
jgi:hypothetical protein